jgi:hypothetical protein
MVARAGGGLQPLLWVRQPCGEIAVEDGSQGWWSKELSYIKFQKHFNYLQIETMHIKSFFHGE